MTAQKREQGLGDVPLSLSVLGGNEIDRSSLASLTGTLGKAPGVAASVGYQGGTTLLTVRGVGASGPLFSGSSPVAYYLDSVPFGFVTSAIAPDASAYDLERIEVLRGPQGTLYGANAQNGVVRVLTRNASPDTVELKARLVGSSTKGGGDSRGADVAVSVPLVREKLAVRAVLGYTSLGGWVDNAVHEDVNDARLRTRRLKINARPDERLSIALSAWSARNDYGAPSASDEDGHVSATMPQPIATDLAAYGLDIDYDFPRVLLSSRTGYLDYSNASVWDLIAAGLANVPFSTDLDSRVFTQEVLLKSPSDDPWRWTAGAAWRDARDRLRQELVLLPAPLDYSFASRSSAVFGEIGRRFLQDRFEWTLGLRYYHDDVLNRENVQDQGLPGIPLYHATRSFESVTPRAVLAWHPGAHKLAYVSYSEGFRSGFPQNASVVHAVPEFPALRPDRLRNFEIGGRASVGRRVSLDFALYYVEWEDVQQALSVFLDGIPVTADVNGESASGAGIDVGLSAQLAAGLELDVGLSWNDLQLDADVYVPEGLLFEKGDRLNYSPEVTGAASARYRFRLGHGFSGALAASAQYSSAQEYRGTNTGTTVLHGDALLLARVSFAVSAPEGWTVSLFADNVTNERGATPTVNLQPEWQLRVRPRTTGVQFDYRF